MSNNKKTTITRLIADKCYRAMGHLCRLSFSALTRSKLSADRQLSDVNMVFLSGRKGAKMLKAVLHSVYYRWEKIPHVIIVSDGTPKEVLIEAMEFWPFPYEVKSWEDCAAYHLEKGRQSLVDYARINVYARKVISVLAEAESRPVLYADTDILWFAEPRLPAADPKKGVVMRMSSDDVHCYHMPTIRYLNRPDMLDKPPLNAGMIFLSGSVYDCYPGFAEYMEYAKIFDEGRSEQMTFALLADRLGDSWSLDEVYLSQNDMYWPLLPDYLFSGKAFARHHVVTKNSWFWRDILLIVLFKRKKHAPITAV
jgi:hypothetical protein